MATVNPTQIFFENYPTAVIILASIGFLVVAKVLISLIQIGMENHIYFRNNLKKYGAGEGAYALVTGSTDGIGKEFAKNLAKQKFNLILVSRTMSKLETVKAEIEQQHKVEVKIYSLDFSRASNSDMNDLKDFIKDFPVTVLVNNVATNHSIPTPFIDETDDVLENIVHVNIWSTLKITKMVLQQMVERGSGLILNVGSFAGMIPTPFLQTYSGSKAFLSTWSEALAQEVRPHGVHVEHLNTYFVVSNMSKMRGSLLVPSASVYVKNVLKRCGSKTHSTPYPLHNLMSWFLETFVSKELLAQKTYEMQTKVRQRALKKLERMKNE